MFPGPYGVALVIGVPKEIENHEYRVGLVPAGAMDLVRAGHDVIVEASAGADSGFSDNEYLDAGARIAPDPEAVYAEADMIVKVKEPLPPE